MRGCMGVSKGVVIGNTLAAMAMLLDDFLGE
jgi:hypothetical protein